ncbi:MAG: 50S ribosomal protein L18 [Actinomycetota bacterium]
MKKVNTRRSGRARRKRSIRRKVNGSPERPRLSVFRSNKETYAQIIDDMSGHTLVSASTREKALDLEGKSKVDAANEAGRLLARRARDEGIEKVVFDRGGNLFHGRVKALANGAREEGLLF